jgi:hypothetical protein
MERAKAAAGRAEHPPSRVTKNTSGEVMKKALAVSLASVLAVSVGWAAVGDVADDMLDRARHFLAGLDEPSREQATFTFDDAERLNWHFIPRARQGLPYIELTPAQRRLADRLLASAFSSDGLSKALGIMYLDQLLFEQEGRDIRNPDGYYFSVFGDPAEQGAWGWRLEGHHLALNVTLQDGEVVAASPAFMGTNPAVVRDGRHAGLEVLAEEQALGRELLALFEGEAREKVVFSASPLRDIATGNTVRAERPEPAGVALRDMNDAQSDALMSLLRVFIDRMHPELAKRELEKITEAGVDDIHFAWAGESEPGSGHYYRIQGPTFLVEFDNTQNNANHVHSVWRDFDGDFGADVLAEHYAVAPVAD